MKTLILAIALTLVVTSVQANQYKDRVVSTVTAYASSMQALQLSKDAGNKALNCTIGFHTVDAGIEVLEASMDYFESGYATRQEAQIFDGKALARKINTMYESLINSGCKE